VLVPSPTYPDDLDTTALALKVLRPSSETTSLVLDLMASYVNDNGTFQVSTSESIWMSEP
jgi:hypothetical protein